VSFRRDMTYFMTCHNSLFVCLDWGMATLAIEHRKSVIAKNFLKSRFFLKLGFLSVFWRSDIKYKMSSKDKQPLTTSLLAPKYYSLYFSRT
jgi:hypothetical protein